MTWTLAGVAAAAGITSGIAFYEREGWKDYGRWFVKPLLQGVGPGGEATDDN